MLAAGYFSPLSGYMNLDDTMMVSANMTKADGLLWPIPIINLSDQCPVHCGERLALRDPNIEGGPILAVMHVDAIETRLLLT